jgi:signal transduction histidine kinase
VLKPLERVIPPNREEPSERDGGIYLDNPKFPNLAEYISQPIWVVTTNGYGECFNPYWGNYTGLSEEESSDFGWSRAFHPEDLGDFMKLLQNSAGGEGREFEARLRRGADGSYRRHVCRSSRVSSQSNGQSNGQSSGPIHLLICCTDVEDWRAAEARGKEQGALLGVCLRSHDQEKRKIAHGLHDSAGQYLVALQMKLDGLQRCSLGSTGRENPIVDECRELVKRCSKELRAISYLLYPPLLDDLGLESAVRLHVDGVMERTRTRIELDIEPNLGRLDRDLEIALFRVVQEALASIDLECGRQSGRRCGDKIAEVKIGASPTSIFAEVRGPGVIEPLPKRAAARASSHAPSGFGVATLQQRIQEAGGIFEMESAASGIVIRAAVPRKARVAQACD